MSVTFDHEEINAKLEGFEKQKEALEIEIDFWKRILAMIPPAEV